MNSTVVELDWKGPYRLADFLLPETRGKYDCPGVYLWIEGSKLYYVGRATGRPTLSQRQVQHYAYQISGLYEIPKEYRDQQEKWVPDWNQPDVAEVLLNRERFAQVVQDGFRFVAALEVYLWPARSDEDVRAIERNLLYDLQPTGTKWGTKTMPSPRLMLRHGSATWLTPEIRNQARPEIILASR